MSRWSGPRPELIFRAGLLIDTIWAGGKGVGSGRRWEVVGGSRGGMRRCETRERVDHGPFLLLARANAPSSEREQRKWEPKEDSNAKNTKIPGASAHSSKLHNTDKWGWPKKKERFENSPKDTFST